jgi:hypothetical protein
MARKSKIFRDLKSVKKTGGKTILNSAVSGIGFLAVKGGVNLIAPKITNPNLQKALGPVAAVAGMVLETFSEQPQLAAVGRGMAIAGIDRSAQDFIPVAVKEKVGLAGYNGVGNDKPSKTVDGGGDQNYWDEVRRKAEEAMSKMNNQPGNDMAGVSNIEVESLM